jgi:hypothetical protein
MNNHEAIEIERDVLRLREALREIRLYSCRKARIYEGEPSVGHGYADIKEMADRALRGPAESR